MSQVITFNDYTPAPRYDSTPWSSLRIEEGVADTGPWVVIETVALSPLDSDPEHPQPRDITTTMASETPALWYRLTFEDGDGNVSQPSVPIQNLDSTPYATLDEFFRILKITRPTVQQEAAAARDLQTATNEINKEIDRASDAAFLTPAELDTCNGVCLDRAADLWRHRESAPGILGVVDEAIPSSFGRYSWERYAQRLSPLKDQWGIA